MCNGKGLSAKPGLKPLSEKIKKKGTGKKKIDIEPISDYQSRMVTFTRRYKGLFKKARKLEEMSGTPTAIIVISETGQPYFHGSPSLPEQFLASTTIASSSSTFTSSSAATTNIGPSSNTTNVNGSSTTAATAGSLEEIQAFLDSEVEACTTSAEAERVKEKLPEIEKWVDDFDLWYSNIPF